MDGGALARLFHRGHTDHIGRPRRNHTVCVAALVAAAMCLAALTAHWLAPYDPYDLAQIDLLNATQPPAWAAEGSRAFWLGTDDQGRDVLSALLHGTQVSLAIALASVALSATFGIFLGLVAGYLQGPTDAFLMRLADVQLSFPAILIALLMAGIGRTVLAPHWHDALAHGVVVIAIALAGWPQYARTVRGATLVEKNKEYILAARLIGVPTSAILRRHLLPNVLGPVWVLATVHVATAILTEATLSFLGVGVPATTPSLGSMIRTGNDFLFSGLWWLTLFPSVVLVTLILSLNLLGDALRDALNPRLQ